jgi:hypothetical protein
MFKHPDEWIILYFAPPTSISNVLALRITVPNRMGTIFMCLMRVEHYFLWLITSLHVLVLRITLLNRMGRKYLCVSVFLLCSCFVLALFLPCSCFNIVKNGTLIRLCVLPLLCLWVIKSIALLLVVILIRVSYKIFVEKKWFWYFFCLIYIFFFFSVRRERKKKNI